MHVIINAIVASTSQSCLQALNGEQISFRRIRASSYSPRLLEPAFCLKVVPASSEWSLSVSSASESFLLKRVVTDLVNCRSRDGGDGAGLGVAEDSS